MIVDYGHHDAGLCGRRAEREETAGAAIHGRCWGAMDAEAARRWNT
jgi:hypothetical protein